MPTKRLRRSRVPAAPVSDSMLEWFATGELPTRDPHGRRDWLEVFVKTGPGRDERARREWELVRDGFMQRWIARRPGTRPASWWKWDSPRWQRDDQPPHVRMITALDCADPRRRVGGVGTPCFEVLNFWPEFSFGVPQSWVTKWDEDFYNGRATDIHGNRIGTEYHEGHFPGLAPDPNNPPTFESQAAYLERHGLLSAHERRRLPAGAFNPEPITCEDA